MNRHNGLATRLRRLEKRHRPRRAPRFIIFAVNEDEAPSPIMGLARLGVDERARRFGEDDFDAFTRRAAAELSAVSAAVGGFTILTATYAPEAAVMAAGEAPRPILADTNPQPFPWHLAGIGRTDERYIDWHPSNSERGQS